MPIDLSLHHSITPSLYTHHSSSVRDTCRPVKSNWKGITRAPALPSASATANCLPDSAQKRRQPPPPAPQALPPMAPEDCAVSKRLSIWGLVTEGSSAF